MIPTLLLQIAWVVIIARCGYKAIKLLNKTHKQWLEIGFLIAVVLVSLSFLL